MQFHSIDYLFFLPCVVMLYFLFPERLRWAVLLSASYLFYAAWRVEFIFLIFLSTVVDFTAALRLEHERNEKLRKAILAVSVIFNLGLLFYFKYIPSVFDGIRWGSAHLFGGDALNIPHLDIILPLGISFYTFQTMSYTIDVYRRRIPAERHLGYFALYVTFFPQLLAGPIERASHLIAQLREKKSFQWSWCGSAFFLIVLGLAKKTVIADRLSQLFNPVVLHPEGYNASTLLLTPIATVYQYYCDLSGYADIAIGSAMLFGIQLSKNFDRPFAATSTIRFWYRWHITVTSWFRDYLMRLFTGAGSVARARPVALIVTGLVIGLWHSPSLGWLIAGISVSMLAIPEIAWTHWRIRRRIRPRNTIERIVWNFGARLYVWVVIFYLIGVPLTWGTLSELTIVFNKIFTVTSSDFFNLPEVASLKLLYVLLVFITMLEVWQWLESKGYDKSIVNALPLELKWFSVTLLIVVTMIFANITNSGFLYFGY